MVTCGFKMRYGKARDTAGLYIAHKLPGAQLLPLWIQNATVFVQITFFLWGKKTNTGASQQQQ